MADNLDRQDDNQDQQDDLQESQDTQEHQEPQRQSPFSWKSHLTADMQSSPTLKKFDDTPEGLGKAVESHLNLEKMLGHDKVPVPKGPDDVEGWARFTKAFGIPENPEGYSLPEPDVPDSMKDLTFDKNAFSQVVHKHKLTPAQAQGLWNEYITMSKDSYSSYTKAFQDHMNETVNKLKAEWGDAYDANVELGQTVISKFAGDGETADFLNTALAKDPRGVKFLAKVGANFAENKIGDFKYSRFSFSPEQAQTEIDQIRNNPDHPYMNEKASHMERQRAIDYVNSLYAVIDKAKG